MKTLRYLLSLIAILSVVSVSAATFGTAYMPNHVNHQPMQTQGMQAPTAAMRSTSAMRYSGSALPMAAATGVSTTCNNQGGPRRAKKEDPDPSNPFNTGGGIQTVENTGNPLEPGTPIGDAILPLMLMLGTYGVLVYFRRKKAAR